MKKQRTIMLIDMQSFYASVEKAAHPEYKDRPLVVAGDPSRRSGIILAACPLAKAYGVITAEALWQALQKCPDLVVVRPHMHKYIQTSMQIKRIIESFTDLVEPYSIDELFADVTGSLHFYNNDPFALAKTPLGRLRSKWGVNGEVLWRVANGLDDSPVSTVSHNTQKDIGNGMTLPRDYREAWEIEVVIQDICTEVCRRARKKGLMGSIVSLSISGADFDHHTGFHRQTKLEDPTNLTQEVYEASKRLFYINWDRQPVRRVGISLSGLTDAETYQITLFDNKNHLRVIDKVMDSIKDRFGDTAILRAASLTSAGQAIDRASKIGGHYK